MIKGWEAPTRLERPRSWMDIPPPGAPELERMFAPVTLLYRAPSVVFCIADMINSNALNELTSFAKIFLLIEDSNPVTTISFKVLFMIYYILIMMLLLSAETRSPWSSDPTNVKRKVAGSFAA